MTNNKSKPIEIWHKQIFFDVSCLLENDRVSAIDVAITSWSIRWKSKTKRFM